MQRNRRAEKFVNIAGLPKQNKLIDGQYLGKPAENISKFPAYILFLSLIISLLRLIITYRRNLLQAILLSMSAVVLWKLGTWIVEWEWYISADGLF